MGKLFAAVVAIITIISVAIFVMHTWWMPIDVSTTGPAIDRQMDDTMIGVGVLFLAGQLVLAAFAWGSSNTSSGRKIKIFPGGATPLVAGAIILVGLEVLTLTFVGSRAWGAIYVAPPPADSMRIDVQAEQFAFYFRYAGPDGVFGSIHPDKINDGSGNYFGLDPENDVAARDDIVVGSLDDSGQHADLSHAAFQRCRPFLLRARTANAAGHRSRARYSRCISRRHKQGNWKWCARSSAAWGTTA